ncbi:MAG: biopolymer transporter ExbD [Bacteroidales bacterium]|nr:biopolymer transporter ExbD [Bacteroidales bacterium]MDY3912828.1 biopolymer transporter ExbD [Sodaliphilus sp.]
MARKDISRQKKFDTRIDFTPMVDMNMLLITFFMLCTTMIKSQTLQISLPTNEKVEQQDQNKVKQSEAITIVIDGKLSPDSLSLASNGMLYYYDGKPDVENNNMKQIKFGAGEGTIRQILSERNSEVLTKINEQKARWKKGEITDEQYQEEAKKIRNNDELKRPVVMIKATANASYADVVNVLDEMQINNISRYQIERMSHVDSVMMMKLQGKPIK